MADRRMLSTVIVESDAFLDMPFASRCLYIHLVLNADDDGFVSSPKKITRMIGATEDDLNLLHDKRYLLGFSSGIVVIKHWKIQNAIRKDRYIETVYQEEKESLYEKDNGVYTDRDPEAGGENSPNGSEPGDGIDTSPKVSTENLSRSAAPLEPVDDQVFTEQEKPALGTNQRKALKGKYPASPAGGKTASDLIQETMDYWNQLPRLPTCTLTMASLSSPGRLATIIRDMGVETIKRGMDNLNQAWEGIEQRYRPKSYQRFILKSAERWANEDHQLKKGRSATAPASDHEREWEDVGEETLEQLGQAVRRTS